MGIIARKLINPHDLADFTKYNSRWLRQSKGASPFYWVVREGGAHIHPKSDLKEVANVFLHIQFSRQCQSAESYMVFEYDGKDFFPVFPEKLLAWGKSHPTYKQYI